MKYSFAFLLFAFTISFLSAQVEVSPGFSADDPAWVQMMYQASPNVDQVRAAYDTYYAEHPFVKNMHTQFYKRWLRGMETYEYNVRGSHLTAAERAKAKASEDDYLRRRAEAALKTSATDNWTCIGPFDWDHDAAGRSYAPGAAHVYTVEQCPNNGDVLYAGTATAGLWVSSDHGFNWSNITKDRMVNQVYAVEIHPNNCDEVLLQMEGGMFRTTDGGANWTEVGGSTFQYSDLFTRDIKYVPGSTTDVWAANNNGLFRSTDRGVSWTQVLSGDDFLEIEFKPGMPSTMYVIRRSGSTCELLKSTNGGTTFAVQGNGWPTDGTISRAEIAVTPATPNRVVASLTGIVNGGRGLYGYYISDDSGDSWSFECCGPQPGGPPNPATNINTMGWQDDGSDDGGQYNYNLSLAVSPTDADHILSGAVNLWVSEDGGQTFTCPAKWSHPEKPDYVHADNHDINYYPNGEIWVANDGGIFFSNDAGATFTRRGNGIAGSDFWGFGVGNNNDELMGGGAYHNGTLIKHGDVYEGGWVCMDGGDGVGGAVNPIAENRFYSNANIKTMPGSRTVAPTTRNYAVEPSWSYRDTDFSQVEWAADNYNVHYFPDGTIFYKTEDDNLTVTQIHDFGEKIVDVEVAWTDPSIMYVSTYTGNSNIYRSADGGASWTNITPPATASSSASNDLAVSYEDPNTIWTARLTWSSGTKVQKSTDGGQTWTDNGSAALDGEVLTNILVQRGSNDQLYVGTTRTVYTAPNGGGNWEVYASGLPAATRSRNLAISYRTNKLYNATNRSVWVSDPATTSAVAPQMSVDKYFSGCARDTFKFADNSTVGLAGPFQWSFPGASYVSDATARNPRVVYGAAGQYDVSLTVGGQTQTKTNFIEIGTECAATPMAGNALSCSGTSNYFLSPSTVVDNSNTITITAWIKPNGEQSDYTGIVFADAGGFGFNYSTNQRIGYHWPGGSTHWGYNSGLQIPADQWSFVAMVASPNSISFYVNEESVTRSISLSPASIAGIRVGGVQNWPSRTFQGEIDEVAIWDRSLTQDEIRLWRHLTLERQANPANGLFDAGLKAYYQFNEAVPGTVYDRVGANHGLHRSAATNVLSSAPIGSGSSAKMMVDAGGTYDFTAPGVSITFPASGTLPNEEIVVTRLENAPQVVPDLSIHPNSYWIINNYGAETFAELNGITFKGIPDVSAGDLSFPEQFVLYKRASNDDNADWGEYIAQAETAETGANISFGPGNTITSFSQFTVGLEPAISLPVRFSDFYLRAMEGRDVSVNWQTATEVDANVFIVEHATDGRTFREVGRQPAANAANGSEYTFVHKDAPGGLNFYRIRSVDLGGEEDLTPLRSIRLSENAAWARVFPNPMLTTSGIQLQSSSGEPTVFVLYDAQGRLIRQTQFIDQAYLRLPGLPAGTYTYQMLSGTQQHSGKLVRVGQR